MTTIARRRVSAAAVLAAMAPIAFAAGAGLERQAPVNAAGARAGFERLRAIAGAWTFTMGSDQGRVSYEVVSNGTAVLERVMNAEHGEAGMVSIIYVEDDHLVLQHYCGAGNQPRLVSPGLEGDEIRFAFDGGGNLSAASAGHIHAAAFRFPDGGTFESQWTWRENGIDTTGVRRHEPQRPGIADWPAAIVGPADPGSR